MFSSEVGTGSREENASKQEFRASVLLQSEPKFSEIRGTRRGAIALNRKAVRLLRRWLAALCLLAPAGLTGAAAEEFRTPSIISRPRRMAGGCRSVPHRDRHPPGDRFPLHVRRPAARAGMGSARDARAGATERHQREPVRRDRTQSGAGAVAVRYRGLPRRPGRRHAASAVALPGRFPPRRPVSRRSGRLRRGVFAASRRRRLADLRQAGRSADHGLDPRLRPRRSARRQGRAGQGAGGAVPRHAPLHP